MNNSSTNHSQSTLTGLIIGLIPLTFLMGAASFEPSPFFDRQIRLGFAVSIGTLILALALRLTNSGILRSIFLRALRLAIITELLLQVLAVMNLMPYISFSYNTPFGRVYQQRADHHNNSLMNRYGWHYPTDHFHQTGRRLVIIGNSYVEALGVTPKQNVGFQLNDLLQKGMISGPEVMSLGRSGTGPAQYLEMLKYAQEHYRPTEAILFINPGSDFTINYFQGFVDKTFGFFVYYTLDTHGQVTIHPESVQALKLFREKLEWNHKCDPVSISRTLLSYSMLVGVLQHWRRGHQAGFRGDRVEAAPESTSGDALSEGLRGPLTPEAQKAFQITNWLIDQSNAFAKANGITLRLVTIPGFPTEFYATYHEGEWSSQMNSHDMFFLEKQLTAYAKKSGIPILPMGQYMQDHRVPADTIKRLYDDNGAGHLSAEGHRFFAHAIAGEFYQVKN